MSYLEFEDEDNKRGLPNIIFVDPDHENSGGKTFGVWTESREGPLDVTFVKSGVDGDVLILLHTALSALGSKLRRWLS